MKVKARNVFIAGTVLALIFQAWIAAQANRRVVQKMSWQYGELSPQWPTSKQIVLNFVEYPHEFVAIYSSDLGPYLESLPDRHVQVVFEVSPLFGGMHGSDWINPVRLLELDMAHLRGSVWHHPVQIGDLTSWHSAFSYSGREGIAEGSPWD